MSKNYVGYVNDHSGSMEGLKHAAAKDFNTNILAVKDAATREELDTVVSVVGIGIGVNGVQRQVVISNPHVLKPVTNWPCPGGTPLFDGIGNIIELHEGLPDYSNPEVSFLIVITTDGQESHSRTKWQNRTVLGAKIAELQKTGRWTFVARVPKGARHTLDGLNIPYDNIQEWDTSDAGFAASTVQTTQAVSSYFTARSAGAKSSSVFYANAANVNTSALVDISHKVSLYVVPDHQDGIQIRDFILGKRTQYLKGAAFYQLMKTEPRVQETKLVAVRDRSTGKIYSGLEARQMIGLPQFGNGRVHPGDHKNYDIFIQSESVNRKLPKGYGVLYWEEKGVPFTQAELERFLGQQTPVAAPLKPAVVQLPAVPVSTKPTPSPIPKTVSPASLAETVDGKPVKFFTSREQCRAAARAVGKFQKDTWDYNSVYVIGANGRRWFYFL